MDFKIINKVLEGFVVEDAEVKKLNDDQQVSEKDGMVILKRGMSKSKCAAAGMGGRKRKRTRRKEKPHQKG